MRRAIVLLLAWLFATLVCAPPAFAEKRVALIIGNGAYANATQLANPKNDAEDVAAALKREGFETIVGIDLDQAKMQDTAIDFARAAREADVALFYYSGHAMQFGGVNYLMPVDAKLSDEADLRRMARVDDILADLQQARNLRILVLDACRDNPFAEQLKRSIGLTRAASLQRGLARIDTPEGMIVAFSTQAQRTAEDGTGRNSPYTTAFLKHIEEPGEIGLIFRRISTDVYETTEHRQLPELSLSMIGEYYLRGGPGQVAIVAPPLSPAVLPRPAEPAVVTVPRPDAGSHYKPGETPEMAVGFGVARLLDDQTRVSGGDFVENTSESQELAVGQLAATPPSPPSQPKSKTEDKLATVDPAPPPSPDKSAGSDGMERSSDLRLCNTTNSRVGVAVGYHDAEGWATEGWWNVAAHTCETILKGKLNSRYYYMHAIDYDKGGEWGGSLFMCTRQGLYHSRH